MIVQSHSHLPPTPLPDNFILEREYFSSFVKLYWHFYQPITYIHTYIHTKCTHVLTLKRFDASVREVLVLGICNLPLATLHLRILITQCHTAHEQGIVHDAECENEILVHVCVCQTESKAGTQEPYAYQLCYYVTCEKD